MRIEHVVRDNVRRRVAVGARWRARVKGRATWRVVPRRVATDSECPRLVECGPGGDERSKSRECEISVLDELADDGLIIRRVPTAHVLVQALRQIPMIEGHVGGDAPLTEMQEEIAVPVETLKDEKIGFDF